MCGIAGFLDPKGFDPGAAHAAADAMSATLAHRGPDDCGAWTDPRTGIALAHRRLAVLDLSPAGHQPMFSASGRFVLVYNGEIYNHVDVRSEIGDHAWRGRSDTETLLAGFERWGVERTLPRLVGMFSIAVWDASRRVLTLARDRLGEKPLYYGWHSGVFLFGSELRALRRHVAFRSEIDSTALEELATIGYITAPRSIFCDTHKLLPGALLEIGSAEARAALIPAPRRYWSLVDAWNAAAPFSGSARDAVEALDSLIGRAVDQQRIADVPLGAFLSGGVDSSLVVALMQARGQQPVRTFTVGFVEKEYDESGHAEAVARHLGTQHEAIRLTDREAMDLVPRMGAIYDEPLGDVSQIPTFLVSSLARRHVTVALSGDGGDELFGGYAHYVNATRLWRQLAAGLRLVRGSWIRIGDSLPGKVLDALLGAVLSLRGRSPSIPPSERVATIVNGLRSGTQLDFSRSLRWQWCRSPLLCRQHGIPAAVPIVAGTTGDSFLEQMMCLDALTYLPDDILMKVDRAAMNVSLETRVPLLDHRVVEFAGGLPDDFRIRDGRGKWVLRQLLRRYVPDELVDRPKKGFSVPIGRWLRVSPIRDWAESLLAKDRLRARGHFDVEAVRKRWHEHLEGRFDWHASLWTILMFEAWMQELGAGSNTAVPWPSVQAHR